METVISSKGQITVPKAIREQLHLEPGDHVRFFIDPDGSARFVPAQSSVKDLKGILPRPAKALTLQEMDQAIAYGANKQ